MKCTSFKCIRIIIFLLIPLGTSCTKDMDIGTSNDKINQMTAQPQSGSPETLNIQSQNISNTFISYGLGVGGTTTVVNSSLSGTIFSHNYSNGSLQGTYMNVYMVNPFDKLIVFNNTNQTMQVVFTNNVNSVDNTYISPGGFVDLNVETLYMNQNGSTSSGIISYALRTFGSTSGQASVYLYQNFY